MNGEYWYKYIKEHKPDALGKDIIDYVEQLKLDKQELQEQLNLQGVINWVALKSNLKPNENTEECLVKYENGKVRTALFCQEDFRFYNSMNNQDITEQIKYYSELPN